MDIKAIFTTQSLNSNATFEGIPFIVGVSGHRQFKNIPSIAIEVEKTLSVISSKSGVCTEKILLTGLALGADQLVAKIALKMGWTVVAVLPMPLEQYLEDFEGADRDSLQELLHKSHHVVTLPLERDVNQKIDRVAQYCTLGKFLVSHSQVMVLLWDGIDSRKERPGGTAWVRHLCQGGALKDYSTEGTKSTCLIQIPVQRDIENSSITSSSPPLMINANWEIQLQHINEFNSHCTSKNKPSQAQLNSSKNYLIPDGFQKNALGSNIERCLQIYSFADSISFADQQRRNRIIKIELSVIASSAFALAMYSGPMMAFGWLAIHLLLLLIFILLYLKYFASFLKIKIRNNFPIQPENLDIRYLDYRALAEGLRVQIFWKIYGLTDSVAENYISRHHHETMWISAALANLVFIDAFKPQTNTPLNARTLLVEKNWIEDQSNYFLGADVEKEEGKYLKHHLQHIFWERLCVSMLTTAILVTILCFITHLVWYPSLADPIPGELELSKQITWLSLFVSIFLILAGAFKAYDDLMGNEDRANNYLTYGRLYRSAKRQFTYVNETDDSNASRASIIRALGKAANEETVIWLVRHRRQSLNLKDQL